MLASWFMGLDGNRHKKNSPQIMLFSFDGANVVHYPLFERFVVSQCTGFAFEQRQMLMLDCLAIFRMGTP